LQGAPSQRQLAGGASSEGWHFPQFGARRVVRCDEPLVQERIIASFGLGVRLIAVIVSGVLERGNGCLPLAIA